MIADIEKRSVILVVEDVEETRDGIERLLTASGYQVRPARDDEEVVLKASLRRPDLILISLGPNAVQILSAAVRIRERTGLSDEIPVVGSASQASMRVLKWKPDITFT